MMEKIYVCTSAERFLMVLGIVEPYVCEVEGPTSWDPGYLLTLNVPIDEWRRISSMLQIN